MGMRRDLSRILVVDLEATCWERGTLPPVGELQEVIEIGYSLVHITNGSDGRPLFAAQGISSIIVRPTRSSVSGFCTELTTLTQEQVDAGVTFEEACRQLVDHDSRALTWASWGNFDRELMARQCFELGVEYPFNRTHINAKNLYSISRGLTSELGLGKAMRHAGLEFIGTPHRGGDDAHNIAQLLTRTFGHVA